MERNYKWLVLILIVAISSAGIWYYLSQENKSDSFVEASLYALLLFIMGIFINYMSNKVDDKLQERIDIYLNLQRINAFFKANMKKNPLDYETTRFLITSFRIFTGRTKDFEEQKVLPYIKERGFKFDAKELQIESDFEEHYSILFDLITNTVKKYIETNKTPLSCNNVVIHGIYDFNPKKWCERNLSDFEQDGEKMVSAISSALNSFKEEHIKIKALNRKVIKIYSNYFARTKRNIKHIERLYGRKLQYEISHQSEIRDNFEYLFKRLDEINDSFEGQIIEHDAKIENYLEQLENVNESLTDLSYKADEIKDAIWDLKD
jgi:hypothetical protein